MSETYTYFINGVFKDSSQKHTTINPATEEPCAQIAYADASAVAEAVQSARQAALVWQKTSYKDRAKVLRDIACVMMDNLQELAVLETKEIGKPFKESLLVDIQLGADCFNYYASFLENVQEISIPAQQGVDVIQYQPYGVVGVYLPYNVPLMIFGFSCAAALAAGNSVVIKPSEFGSLSMARLAKFISAIDMPQGLINVLTGTGDTVGAALAASAIDCIAFTGSRHTLQKIVAASAAHPKKIVCELGGCNIAAVFADANQDSALENIIASGFMKQGQTCVGTSLVLVEEKIYDSFMKRFAVKVHAISCGDPFDPQHGMGPLPTAGHRQGVHEKVQQLLAAGGSLVCGGSIPRGKGFFYPPTIVAMQTIVYEELFAPVVMVKRCADKKEMEAIIANNPTGLALQLWTADAGYADALAKHTACGTVWINTFVQMNSSTPFGGCKASGWGRNLGQAGFFEYTHLKHVGVGYAPSAAFGWFGV